jgi:Tfp pilus assembly protein PilF
MTTIHQYRILLIATLGLATATGCTSSGWLPWNSASPAASSESESAASARSTEELPPKEAARACLAAAEQMQNSGQTAQAIGLYEKARRNDPGLKFIAHHLAVLYDIQGDSTRSLAEYKLAIEAEPQNADVFNDLGYYYFTHSNLSDAERELRKAIQLAPKHQKALTNLGMVLAGEKRFDESFAVFSQAVGPAAAHSNVGVLLAKQGRTDEARKEFHEALALDSTLNQPKAFLEYLDRSR